jgi:hypothetical protein
MSFKSVNNQYNHLLSQLPSLVEHCPDRVHVVYRRRWASRRFIRLGLPPEPDSPVITRRRKHVSLRMPRQSPDHRRSCPVLLARLMSPVNLVKHSFTFAAHLLRCPQDDLPIV